MIKTKIKKQDLKIFPSERLTDTPDGGGLMVGTPLTGAENELFPPIDAISFAKGGLDLRKIYVAVDRADDEPLLGGNVILSEPAKHPSVSFLLYEGASHGEERKDAVRRIEGYSVDTIESRMTLLGIQAKGAAMFQAYQRVEDPLPKVGDIYSLSQKKAGYEEVRQPIQVRDVSHEVRTFTRDANGQPVEFDRRVVRIATTAPLLYGFVGVNYPSPFYMDAPCKIVETTVADSGRYYGVKPLAANAEKDASKVKVTDIKEKIVPTSRVETPYRDIVPASNIKQAVISARLGSEGEVRYQSTTAPTAGVVWYLGTSVEPGVRFDHRISNLSDNQQGEIYQGSTKIADIDYKKGEISYIKSPGAVGSYLLYTIIFRPQSTPVSAGETAMIPIERSNQASNYVLTIDPPPGKESLTVSYLSQNNWYDLVEQPDGTLSGYVENYGVGTVDRATNTVIIDLKGNIPDAGSAIMLQWASPSNYINRADNAAIKVAETKIKLAGDFAAPGTVTMTWGDGSNTYSVTDDGSGGMSGSGLTGQVSYADTTLRFAHANLPAASVDYEITYQNAVKVSEAITPPTRIAGNDLNFSLPPNITPRSLSFITELVSSAGHKQTVSIIDDGAGNLLDNTNNVGTIDYATGAVALNPDTYIKQWYEETRATRLFYNPTNPRDGIVNRTSWVEKNVWHIHDGADIAATYVTASGTSVTETHTVDTLKLDLTPGYSEQVVPEAVFFKLGGRTYFERDGKLYCNHNITDNTSLLAGDIDYATGVVEISDWAVNTAADFSMIALLTSPNRNPVSEVVFRVPSAPVLPRSLQVRCKAVDGRDINAIVDADGVFNSGGVIGKLQHDTGVTQLKFGEMVTAAGNESEPWYHADAVDGSGKIFKPSPIFAETLKYNAVSFTNMPLDADKIGINPATLPIDGRVPIYRIGDVVAIGARYSQELGSALTPAQTIQLNVTDLTGICVQDANNKPVLIEHYDYDLSAGTITFPYPLDLSDYAMPLVAHYSQEENAVISGVNNDNTLSLNSQLTRNYDAAHTYVSTALLTGDLQVRTAKPWTQASWTNEWADERNSGEILYQLDTRNFPIVLTNDGAITERFVGILRNGSQFDFYGETIGYVASGDMLTEFAPINPSKGKPYLTLPLGIFGDVASNQWPAGSCFRINVFGTSGPTWALRAIQPTTVEQTYPDGCSISLRGSTIEDKI